MKNIITLVSWNVNGIRAAVKNGFTKFLKERQPDILCLQEVKINDTARDKIKFDFPDYQEYWHSAERPGYSGTATFINNRLMKICAVSDYAKGVNPTEPDQEGRAQTFEFTDFYLLNIYFPNTRHDLSRLAFKLQFNKKIFEYVKKLEKKKPIIMLGDFNVAHTEIDLANPKENEQNAGFTKEERESFDKFLKENMIDTFRHFYPKTIKYTWWTYRFGARRRNIGWRIDYAIVSKKLLPKIKLVEIWDDVTGSDHCPVMIKIEV